MPTGRRRTLVAAFLAGFVLGPAAVPAAEPAGAVATDGYGELTMCRSWLLFSTCQDYNHVPLPNRVRVGDMLRLRFGSNRKDYNFPVTQITVEGDRCTLLSDGDGDGNKIKTAPCRPAAK